MRGESPTGMYTRHRHGREPNPSQAEPYKVNAAEGREMEVVKQC